MKPLAVVDTLASAVAFGSVVYFFVQSLVLVRRLGRARFVPLQLSLVGVLFWSVTFEVTLALIAALVSGAAHEALLTGGSALGLALLLTLVVMPRAVRAGGASLNEQRDEAAEHSAAAFTADGGGAATRFWHRALGLLTLALAATLGVHLALPLAHAAPPHHHEAAQRWKANAETTAGVRELQALVVQARAHELTPGEAATRLRSAWVGIFERCTMTGAAHEALHAFLLPIDGLLTRLSTAEGAAADAVLEELAAHLATYDAKFE